MGHTIVAPRAGSTKAQPRSRTISNVTRLRQEEPRARMSKTRPSQEEDQHNKQRLEQQSHCYECETSMKWVQVLTQSRTNADDGIFDACEGVSCQNNRPLHDYVYGMGDNMLKHDLCVPNARGLFGSNRGEDQSVNYFETHGEQQAPGKNETISRTILPELFSKEVRSYYTTHASKKYWLVIVYSVKIEINRWNRLLSAQTDNASFHQRLFIVAWGTRRTFRRIDDMYHVEA